MEYSHWDKEDFPADTVMYGFRVDVNNVYTKLHVSKNIKKFIIVEDSRTGRKYFHNVLKNGKIGSIVGSLYYYSLYLDQQEALMDFDLKKQKLKNQINTKAQALQSLIQLIP